MMGRESIDFNDPVVKWTIIIAIGLIVFIIFISWIGSLFSGITSGLVGAIP